MNQEKNLRKVLRELMGRNSINKTVYDQIAPTGTRPGVLYGLCKVHKSSVDGCPPFRPILSAIGTPQYALAKLLVPLLAPITSNEFSVKDSFSFAKEVVNQDSNLHMASLDVDSLFTNIPLQETIKFCVENLFTNANVINGLNKQDLKRLLELATMECTFLFNGKLYKQIDGVAMGSPLGPALANIFMANFEKIWLNACPVEFKPRFYRRYVDDIFVLFSEPRHVDLFQNFMNNKHRNIHFTYEQETADSFPFLDVKVTRENAKFTTSVYRKPTFSGVYSNFSSFIPTSYKFGLVYTLLHRCFVICSNFNQFHKEVVFLKTVMSKNGYPLNFIDACVKKFLSNVHRPKISIAVVPKKEFTLVLPYVGSRSLGVRARILKLVKDTMPQCNIRVVFQSSTRLAQFFRFKDRVPKCLRSGVVYKFMCGHCNVAYYGETERHLHVRAAEHLGVSPLTGKLVSQASFSAVREHTISCGYNAGFSDFSVLSSANSNFVLRIQESLEILRDNPALNRQLTSLPLLLFD